MASCLFMPTGFTPVHRWESTDTGCTVEPESGIFDDLRLSVCVSVYLFTLTHLAGNSSMRETAWCYITVIVPPTHSHSPCITVVALHPPWLRSDLAGGLTTRFRLERTHTHTHIHPHSPVLWIFFFFYLTSLFACPQFHSLQSENYVRCKFHILFFHVSWSRSVSRGSWFSR